MATVRIGTGAIFLCSVLLLSNVVEFAFAGGILGGLIPGGFAGGPIATVFNVVTFGAVPDGKTDNTEAFMKTWVAACHWRGGNAKMLIPGGNFVLGPVVFQGPCNSPIMFQIKGTLLATTDISEYDASEWVSFEHIQGLQINGGGTFDGRGESVWKYNDCHHNSDCAMLPTSIKFMGITNGNVHNFNSLNSKAFHIHITNCNNFKIHDLHITAPKESPNTDGIHISQSHQVRISRCVIATGDDCISVGQGVSNASISRIDCGPGHGISIGSLGKYKNEQDVTGIIVRNSTLTGTDNGLRIKTWPGSTPSRAAGLIFRDITMTDVKNPIIIDQAYCASSGCKGDPSRVAISDVHFRDIHGTSVSDVAVNIACSPAFPCKNVNLFNVNLKYVGTKPAGAPITSTCSNVKLNYGGQQSPPPCR